jgi:hypothetical protein
MLVTSYHLYFSRLLDDTATNYVVTLICIPRGLAVKNTCLKCIWFLYRLSFVPRFVHTNAGVERLNGSQYFAEDSSLLGRCAVSSDEQLQKV